GRVSGHRQHAHVAGEPHLLQRRATQHLPCHGERFGVSDPNDVRRHRRIHAYGDVRHYLVAARRTRCDNKATRRRDLHDRRRPSRRRVRIQPVTLGMVDACDTLLTELVRHGASHVVGQRADDDCLEFGIGGPSRDVAGERERLARGERRTIGVGFDQYEDHREITPISVRMSTSAGAASGPWPRTCTELGCSGGNVSRTRPLPTGSRFGMMVSSGARLAFIRPGMDGYRGSTPPSCTAMTAGSGNSNTSVPVGPAPCAMATPSATSIVEIPVSTGRSSAYARRTPTWKSPESAASLPTRTRSYDVPSAARVSTTSAIDAATSPGPKADPSASISVASAQPTASASRSCSTASSEPSDSTLAVPSVAWAICTASSIAHSSCVLMVCPSRLASTDCSSAVRATE